MPITNQDLERLLDWSSPTEITNSRGLRLIRTAPPTAQFWVMWREDAESFRRLNVTPRRDTSGNWTVTWYMDPIPAASTPPAPVSRCSSAVPSTATGRTWSDEQIRIFEWFSRPNFQQRALVVRARAGTGKTTTIKAAFSVAPESRMLYAVFNKKNQLEAAEAIQDDRVEIKTLHSVGFAFIQSIWSGVRPDDGVENDRIESVVGQNCPVEVRGMLRKLVAFAKNCYVNPSSHDLISLANDRDIECPAYESDAAGGWTVEKLATTAISVLEASTVRDPQGRVSFNDMVWLPVRMSWVRPCYDLVVVDEAQDMNVPQLTMARMAKAADGRICVVGDDRQAIYGFRGAASDGMSMMVSALNAVELGLTTTYRCPKAVVALAAMIVPDYKAAPTAPDGVVEYLESHETAAVGDAILSRSNAPLMPICLSLLRRGIRARVEGRDVGKSLLAIVKKLNARTVPQFLQKLEAWSTRQIARLASDKNFEKKVEELDDTVATLRAIVEGVSGVSEIESRLNSLFCDSQNPSDPESRLPKVTLSSVHKAKGMEWNKVYLISKTFNRRRSPSSPPLSEAAEAARAKEEANIYYVALTRAKSHLVIVRDAN